MSEAGASNTRRESAGAVRSRRGRRILTFVLIVLLLTLGIAVNLLYRLVGAPGGAPVAADSGELQWIRSIYGMSDAPEDQLYMVQAAVPDSDGSIWVTDGEHGMLMRFGPSGQFIETVDGTAEAPLFAPARLAVGPDGLVYACETMSDLVRVVDRDGNEAGSFAIPQPVSVAVDEEHIVVGSVSGFAILNKQGEPLHIIGSRGKGDLQFDYVHGVAISEDGQTVYVTDSYNNRLSAYTIEGERLWMIRAGKPGNGAEMVGGKLTVGEATDAALEGEDQLQLPLGLTLDGAGRIVVVDMFECALAVFEPDGTFVAKYGVAGADDGQFFYPVSVSYDEDRDWFTVADNLNNRVQVVRIPGSGGEGAAAAVRRALSGPLRACIPPFLLLILALTISLFVRARRKRAAQEEARRVTETTQYPTEEW